MSDNRALSEQLTAVAVADHKGDCVFREVDIRALATTVIALDGKGLLAAVERDTAVSFVVFAFSSSNVDGTDAVYECIFHGNGFAGGLRELRHSYWGEDGYVFYPSATLIAGAFKELQRWFDCE